MRIAEYVGERVCSFNSALGRLQGEIALAREYRTRLITDVVTGKLDVRTAAENLPDELDETDAVEDELLDGEEDIEDAELDLEPEEVEV